MDELAAVLGLDPVELRLRNFAERDTAKDLPWTSNRLRECYQVGAERFGWDRRPLAPRSMSADGELAGFGMATAMNTSPRYPARASATVCADGTAVIRSATSDMGPGTYTSMTQLAADALRLPVSQVRFELGDSALPKAQEHGGSTTLASVGSAVRSVCAELRRRLDDLAAQHDCDPADIAGVLKKAGTDQLTASGGAQPGGEQTTHSAYSFGAVFAEVRVDPDLCEIRVPRMLGVYDIGRVVNPRLARSQVIGGMTGGLGMALLEDTEWDERHGRVVNANLAEYLVPVCADVRDLDVTFLPGHDPVANPLGTKGVAELGLCGVAPAIANAVWHATGIRMREMPITLDKLLTASHVPPVSRRHHQETPVMRLPLLPVSDISDDRRQLYDAFVANVRDNFPDIVTMREDGALLGPWGVWMQLPDVGKPMLQLIEAIRRIPGLSPAARQVVILMVGGRYRAAYEIYAHAAAARHAGLSDQQIATLLAGGLPRRPRRRAERRRRRHRALLDGAVLPRPVYDRALEQLGQEGLNAVIFTAAQYSFVAVMLNAYNVPSPQES